jgi:hypothetical protein
VRRVRYSRAVRIAIIGAALLVAATLALSLTA